MTSDELTFEEQLKVLARTEPSSITWLTAAKDYAEEFGMTLEDVERIVRAKGRHTVDPHTHDVGHLVVRYYAGDVVVVVGYQKVRHPKIMSVQVAGDAPARAGSRTPMKGGSNAPTSVRDLTKRILAAGYKVEQESRTGHMRVVDAQTGDFLMALPGTPSDRRTIPNVWATFLRKSARARFEEE